MAVNYKQLFMNYCDSEGIKYNDDDEETVSLSYRCDNLEDLRIVVFFHKDRNDVQFWSTFASAKDEKRSAGLLACNSLNQEYRWVRFYLDKDWDLICEADALLDPSSGGEECLSIVRRMVNIIDEAYPKFMKTLWAN